MSFINLPLVALKKACYYRIWVAYHICQVDIDCLKAIKLFIYKVCMMRQFKCPLPEDYNKHHFICDQRSTYMNEQGIVFKLRGSGDGVELKTPHQSRKTSLISFLNMELYTKQPYKETNIPKFHMDSLLFNYYPNNEILAIDFELSGITNVVMNLNSLAAYHQFFGNPIITVY